MTWHARKLKIVNKERHCFHDDFSWSSVMDQSGVITVPSRNHIILWRTGGWGGTLSWSSKLDLRPVNKSLSVIKTIEKLFFFFCYCVFSARRWRKKKKKCRGIGLQKKDWGADGYGGLDRRRSLTAGDVSGTRFVDRRGVKNKTIRTAVDEQVAFQRIDFFFFRVKKKVISFTDWTTERESKGVYEVVQSYFLACSSAYLKG